MGFTLSKADVDRVEKAAAEATNKFVRGVPQFVEDALEKACLHALGLKADWNNGYVVDTSTLRDGPVTVAIVKLCKDEVKSAADAVARETVKEILKDAKFVAAVAKEARDAYRRELRTALARAAEAYAELQAKALVEGLDKVDFGELTPVKDGESAFAARVLESLGGKEEEGDGDE